MPTSVNPRGEYIYIYTCVLYIYILLGTTYDSPMTFKDYVKTSIALSLPVQGLEDLGKKTVGDLRRTVGDLRRWLEVCFVLQHAPNKIHVC